MRRSLTIEPSDQPTVAVSAFHLWVANWQIWHESPLWCSLVPVQIGLQDSFQLMRDLLLLAIHLLVALSKLLGPGGACQVAAESPLLNHQLLISNRSRKRAPSLTMALRFHIRSSNVSSELSGGNTLIRYFFLERRGLGAQAE
jgi:hypothetical protein